MAHPNLLCYHSLCSMLGAVERDSVPSVDVHGQLLPDAPGEHQQREKILLHGPKHTTEAMIT